MLLAAGSLPEFTGGTEAYCTFCEKNELEERQMRKSQWEEMNLWEKKNIKRGNEWEHQWNLLFTCYL